MSDGTQRLSRSEQALLARTVLRLLERWSAGEEDSRAILGGLSPVVYCNWKRGRISRLTSDQTYRLALLLQIHKSLRMRFKDRDQASGWMARPNMSFGGPSPLQLIAAGDVSAIERVLAYLAAEISPD